MHPNFSCTWQKQPAGKAPCWKKGTAGRSSGAGISSSSAKSNQHLLQLLLQLHTSPSPLNPRALWCGDCSSPTADTFQ